MIEIFLRFFPINFKFDNSRYTISYFLKKPDGEKKKKNDQKRVKKDKTRPGKAEQADEWTEVSVPSQNRDMMIDEITGRVKIFPKDVDINPKNVILKLAEINTQVSVSKIVENLGSFFLKEPNFVSLRGLWV